MFKSTFAKWGVGTVLSVGFVAGIIFWGGFNTILAWTNTEKFCISCHEMRDNVYQELQDTIHYTNRTGVRATCPDCHVPREWIYKIRRKIQASNELYHKFMGTIDTREKFEAKRIELARHEWARMKANDSRECRNCHNFMSMDFEKQEERSANRHDEAIEHNEKHPDNQWTCIDCHRGIAHQLPEGYDPADDTPASDEAESE